MMQEMCKESDLFQGTQLPPLLGPSWLFAIGRLIGCQASAVEACAEAGDRCLSRRGLLLAPGICCCQLSCMTVLYLLVQLSDLIL